MNKKGLLSSIIAVMFTLFLLAVSSIFAISIWNDINDNFQALPEDVANNVTKAQIQDLGQYVGWADRLFSFFIIVLILGLLITSFTLPAQSYWFLILYFAVLLVISIVSMFLSNAWTVLIEQPELISTLGSLSFTDFVMRTFPYIVFFTGLLSGLIFYLRARNTAVDVGGGDF